MENNKTYEFLKCYFPSTIRVCIIHILSTVQEERMDVMIPSRLILLDNQRPLIAGKEVLKLSNIKTANESGQIILKVSREVPIICQIQNLSSGKSFQLNESP